MIAPRPVTGTRFAVWAIMLARWIPTPSANLAARSQSIASSRGSFPRTIFSDWDFGVVVLRALVPWSGGNTRAHVSARSGRRFAARWRAGNDHRTDDLEVGTAVEAGVAAPRLEPRSG